MRFDFLKSETVDPCVRYTRVGSRSSTDFNQGLTLDQGRLNCGPIQRQLGLKRSIGGVADPEPYDLQSWAPARPVGKVGILGPNDRPHVSRLGFNRVVRRPTQTEIVDMMGDMASLAQPSRQARWQLRVNQETHDQAI